MAKELEGTGASASVCPIKTNKRAGRKDNMKKYIVSVGKTISVLANDEYEAEEQAKLDFDNTDLEVEVIEEQTSEQKG